MRFRLPECRHQRTDLPSAITETVMTTGKLIHVTFTYSCLSIPVIGNMNLYLDS